MQKKKINPWFAMWFFPREAIRVVLDTSPKRGFFFLAFLTGLCQSGRYIYTLFSTKEIPFIYLVLSLVAAFVFGILFLLMEATCIYFTGKIIKGKARWIELLAAVSWAKLPLFLLVVLGPLFFLIPQPHPVGIIYSILTTFAVFFVLIDSICIWLANVSEVQRFSKKKAFVNWLFSLILYLIFWVVVAIFAAVLINPSVR